MGFWSDLFGGTPNHDGVTSNESGPGEYNPGDPDGVEIHGEPTESRALPYPMPSPWSGWPAEWSTPNFNTQAGLGKLIDTAWACLDLNASVLSTMPVYRLQSGRVVSPRLWMANPDPDIYSSWQEFAKQLFWDYMLGEAFVLPMAYRSDNYPLTFRVVPPWLLNVEMRNGRREYKLGAQDVTGEILHIRYQSSTADARGHGPLEVAGARMTTAGLLQRYAQNLAETGGTPHYWLGVDRTLKKAEADDLLNQWVESRTRHAGHPALLSGGASLNQLQAMSARDMALLELAQFSEARIATLLGVPPFLVGLPSGGDSLTYSTVAQLFDFHDRSSLRPKAAAVTAALSGWALPHGQSVELNRDEYTRPSSLKERAEGYKILAEMQALDKNEVRAMERLHGEPSALSLTGGDDV